MCRSPVQLQLGEWGTQLEGECNNNFIMTFDRFVYLTFDVSSGLSFLQYRHKKLFGLYCRYYTEEIRQPCVSVDALPHNNWSHDQCITS